MSFKNIIIKTTLLASVAVLGACTANYMDLNTNPYEVGQEEMERDGYIYRAALVGMQGEVISLNPNRFQFVDCLMGGSYGGYLADTNSGFNTGKFSTYNPQQNWVLVMFNEVIPEIYGKLTQLKANTEDPIMLAVAEIVKVAAVQRVTDAYGPIPYSKIGEDGALTAPYDSQQDVYLTLIAQLTSSINTLTTYQTEYFSANADKVFGGEVVKWVRFANSLKLRLAVRMRYANETLARQYAEEVVNHEVGPMASNSDNAFMEVTNNPYRVVMYEWNAGDSRISADIASYMNGYNDPRRNYYFTEATFDTDDYPLGVGYKGMRNGIEIPEMDEIKQYSNMVVSSSSRLMWMNAAETAFLKAEGAFRGWSMGGTAQSFYEEGIALSFDQWGAAGAGDYINDASSMPELYVDPVGMFSFAGSAPTVTIKWDDSASDELKLERIITQKWIANFPLGHEAWSEYRRTGYPRLMSVVTNNSGGNVTSSLGARRIEYPQTEYTENGENVREAVATLLGGADNMGTRIWWDCNPRIN